MNPDCQSLLCEFSTERDTGRVEILKCNSFRQETLRKAGRLPPSQTSWALLADASERWVFEGKLAFHSSDLCPVPQHGTLHDRLQ